MKTNNTRNAAVGKWLITVFLFTFFFLLSTFYSFSQTLNPFYQEKVNQVSFDSLLNTLKKIELLGVKTTPSIELSNASVWLYNKYQELGYTDIKRDTFLYSTDTLLNIAVTKAGISHPEKILIICGHYDSKTGPGVNDNGSGISIILEIARLLINVQTEYTVRFINFTGEELGFLGSNHYVDYIAVPQNHDILLVLNIDEVGGVSGMVNNIIKCEKDFSSPFENNALSSDYTDTLVTLVHLYSGLQTEISYAYGSDYVPFQQAGFTITGLFEYNQSPFIHTINDSLSNLDTGYVFEIAKASVGACLYFSKAFSATQIEDSEKKNNKQIIIYPNPFSDYLFAETDEQKPDCQFQLYDILGNIIFSVRLDKLNTESVFCKLTGSSIYFYKIIMVNSEQCIAQGKLIKIR